MRKEPEVWYSTLPSAAAETLADGVKRVLEDLNEMGLDPNMPGYDGALAFGKLVDNTELKPRQAAKISKLYKYYLYTLDRLGVPIPALLFQAQEIARRARAIGGIHKKDRVELVTKGINFTFTDKENQDKIQKRRK